VGKFDEAFKSRIHISLYYPVLGAVASRKIWTGNLNNIKRHMPDVVFDKDDILEYASEHFAYRKDRGLVPWDGRQIRNAFQTALALAEFEQDDGKAVNLTKDHFEKVTHASEEFDNYLQDTRNGADDLDWAKQKLERNDRSKRLQMNSNNWFGATPTQMKRSAGTPSGLDNSSMSMGQRNQRYNEDDDNDGRDHARPTTSAKPHRYNQNEDDLELRATTIRPTQVESPRW
jgi:hypothetical protein